jgi:hypothetical protein
MLANHAVVSPQALLNALSKHATFWNALKENIKLEPTKLIHVALLHAVLLAHQTSATAKTVQSQHVNVMKI